MQRNCRLKGIEGRATRVVSDTGGHGWAATVAQWRLGSSLSQRGRASKGVLRELFNEERETTAVALTGGLGERGGEAALEGLRSHPRLDGRTSRGAEARVIG